MEEKVDDTSSKRLDRVEDDIASIKESLQILIKAQAQNSPTSNSGTSATPTMPSASTNASASSEELRTPIQGLHGDGKGRNRRSSYVATPAEDFPQTQFFPRNAKTRASLNAKRVDELYQRPFTGRQNDQLYVDNAKEFTATLTQLYVRPLINFINAAAEHEARYGRAVPLAAHVSDTVRTTLISTYCSQVDKTFDVRDWYTLDNDAVRNILIEAVLPTNATDWSKSFNKAVVFTPPKVYVNMLNFAKLYEPLLNLIKQAQEAYSILTLAQDHKGNNLEPKLWKAKDGPGAKTDSLVTLFLGRMDKTFSLAFHEAMQLDGSKDSIKTFPDYLDAWTVSLRSLREVSITSTPAYRALLLFCQAYNLTPSTRFNSNTGAIVAFPHSSQPAKAIPPPKDPAPKSFCYYKLNGKPCKDDGKCPYSHTAAVWQAELRRLQGIRLTDDKPITSATHILKRPDQRPPQRIASVEIPAPGNADDEQQSEGADSEANDDDIAAYNCMLADELLSDEGGEDMVAIVNNTHKTPSVSLSVYLHIGDQTTQCTALLDSGCLAGSYISTNFYNQHKKKLTVRHLTKPRSVPLADGQSKIQYDKEVSLTGFVEHSGRKQQFHFPARVSDIFCDLIIGLPVLEGVLLDFYVSILKGNRTQYGTVDNLATIELRQPFSEPVQVAQEELDIPDPASFNMPDGAQQTAMPSQDAINKYFQSLSDHIDDNMKDTGIREFMETQEAKEVFVPHNWNGLKDVEVQLTWHQQPPARKPKARFINPRVFERAEAELKRLCVHFYEPSTSDVASNIVTAPKATEPFVRICGDYPWLKPYMEVGHYPMRHPQHDVHKAVRFKLFIDADMANSFHQFKLNAQTSAYLSVVTPLGQYQPRFMPEGIPPASAILQKTVNKIFADFEEWTIIIFDNFLILGTDPEDLFQKWRKFVHRCHEHNLFLKLSKTWIGVTEASFFGYKVKAQRWMLSDDRAAAVSAIPFPSDPPANRAAMVKRMQRYLGSALFFSHFVPHYAQLSAPLNEMIKNNFDWNPTTWTQDYRAVFDNHKKALTDSFALYHPDYTATWYLRTDASMHGVGGVLFQRVADTNQPLRFISQKFSEPATRWSVIEQEAFGIFFCVQKLQYYLRGKSFIIETDHRNLLWMESSIVPKIIRMRIYLSSFDFLVQHIAGHRNLTADLLSRDFPPEDMVNSLGALDSMLPLVHGGRNGHMGVKRTWTALNKLAPGHGLSVSEVRDFISECPICQKDRHLQRASIPSLVKTLHADHARQVVAVDTLTITPDQQGNKYLLVIINLFTKYVVLYAVADKTAETTATKLFSYLCTYGLCEMVHSDPGSDFTSQVFAHLTDWLGLRRSLSLVNRPQADGVERVNQEILRHIRALCLDEDVANQWSNESVLPIIQLIINEQVHTETGASPLELTFGSLDTTYFMLPTADKPPSAAAYVKQLDSHLRHLREVSAAYQQSLKSKRVECQPPEAINRYQPGDWVTHMVARMEKPTKLHTRRVGPYRVLSHPPEDNLVTVRDLVHDSCQKFHMDNLQIFVGTEAQALQAARSDDHQHTIDTILGFRGNPELRSTCSFLVRFGDGEEVWLPFGTNINTTAAFEKYCSHRPELRILLLTQQQVKSSKRLDMSNMKLQAEIGSTRYISLQAFGYEWYAARKHLPDRDTRWYVTTGVITKSSKKASTRAITVDVFFPDFNYTIHGATNWWITLYGSQPTMPPNATLLTPATIQEWDLQTN